jgi:hypothetical protein
MFSQQNWKINKTLKIGDKEYDGTQDEIRVPRSLPFDYGMSITVGGTRYLRAEVTPDEYVYRKISRGA